MNTVIEQALSNMTIEEKIILVEDIWDTIAASKETSNLTDVQIKDLEQREEHYKQNPGTALSWDSYRSELEKE
ncbi:MAG: addiction module protein [Spirochaetales bacterium]|nr:addiction module protein [Spirochaetales bacterium]